MGERLGRYVVEERAASALNHPNICTVHEVGEQCSVAYIVAEFIEGRSLAQLIPHAGLPPETVIRYGIQIADALAHAHHHGVIHLDLKSSNVVIAKDGRAEVLDFGLARRVSTALAGAETPSRSAETDAGPLAGTLAHMPPEQLLGQAGDRRGDVWSLRVLLHEMASGALPFRGRDRARRPFVRQASGGRRVQLTDDEAHETTPAFSPDGQRVAFARRRARDEQPEACIMPALGGVVGCVVRAASTPAWSPDGRRIAFSPDRSRLSGIFVVNAWGGTPVRLAEDGGWPVWWPSGCEVAHVGMAADDGALH